jgi:hypothetical protein
MVTNRGSTARGPRYPERDMINGPLVAVIGPPRPARGEERHFHKRQRDEAAAWALAGGIAIHCDVDRRHGCNVRLRVVGQLPVLFAWASREGLPLRCVRAGGRRLLPYIDVSGVLAEDLVERTRLAEERPR